VQPVQPLEGAAEYNNMTSTVSRDGRPVRPLQDLQRGGLRHGSAALAARRPVRHCKTCSAAVSVKRRERCAAMPKPAVVGTLLLLQGGARAYFRRPPISMGIIR